MCRRIPEEQHCKKHNAAEMASDHRGPDFGLRAWQVARPFLAEEVQHGARRRQQYLVRAADGVPLPHDGQSGDLETHKPTLLQLM